MKIDKVIRKAMKQGKGIRRNNKNWKRITLIPTNTTGGIYIDIIKNDYPARSWQPSAEDLIANDWEVCS